MNEARKVRGDAKLERLNAEQRERLLIWLDDENRTYLEVAALVRTEFGLGVGKSAVADYWRRHVMPQRCREQTDTAEELAALPEGKFVEAMMKLAKRQAWLALCQPQPDVRKAAAMMSLVHGVERADLARQRMALAERRVAVAERSAVPAQPECEQPLSDEEKARLLGKLCATSDIVLDALPQQNSPLFPGSAAVSGGGQEEEAISVKENDIATHELHVLYEIKDEPQAENLEPCVEAKKAEQANEHAHLDAMPAQWRTWHHGQSKVPLPTMSPLHPTTDLISAEQSPHDLKKAS